MADGKHARILLCGVAATVIVVGYAWWPVREVEVTGRVALRAWNGAWTVPSEGRAVLLPASQVEHHVKNRRVAWLRQWEEAEAERERARADWDKHTASRDEAVRVLRVAERANTPDLELCRQRLAEAEEMLGAAFARLERWTEQVEESADPRAVLEGLEGLEGAGEAVGWDEDGRFAIQKRAESRSVVMVTAEPWLVWLEEVVEQEGGAPRPLEFSSGNLLDAAAVRRWADE